MIALIVAYSKNHVIGNQGQIPWIIKGEQKRFKELTTGNIVIMGRRSYEEIGKPLPGRTTIVISKTHKYEDVNCFTCESLDEALVLSGNNDVYIAGGARLYKDALDIVDKMYITLIDTELEGDTFFPEFDENKFHKEIVEEFDGDIPYTYLTYTRIHS
jgi:Dihydrofolate reductase